MYDVHEACIRHEVGLNHGSSGESPLDRLTSTMPYQSRIPRRDHPPNLFPFPGLETLA